MNLTVFSPSNKEMLGSSLGPGCWAPSSFKTGVSLTGPRPRCCVIAQSRGLGRGQATARLLPLSPGSRGVEF